MDKSELRERFLDFGARSIRVGRALPRTPLGNHISLQFIPAATSSGANYCEACGAESRQDFAHKLQVAIKELREADYWLHLVARSELVAPSRLQAIMAENNELIAICVASVRTAKGRSAGGAS